MPKRQDIDSILIIGAGPIVIGQACEFDYSGTQACKALKNEGYRIVLVNSNPATIMTDPELADATYIEPITPEIVAKIIKKEKQQFPKEKMVLLPTMGGQTALNTALSLKRDGTLDKFKIEMIGADSKAIDKAEDRDLFRTAMANIGLATPKSEFVNTSTLKDEFAKQEKKYLEKLKKANEAQKQKLQQQWQRDEEVRLEKHKLEAQRQALNAYNHTGLPAIIRPSFTMGGQGGGIAYTMEELYEYVLSGIAASPTNEVLVEESVLGWKEYEMEVVRDKADNCIIICSIENLDPMGVHTGDSITIAPALTLTDKEFQIMRNASLSVLREIGVETGGSNVQFAVNPKDGRLVVIEMNPRVSRSSALASKATGFPIAKVAALLAVGYTLDELNNDITGGATPASFEPSLDYVVVKIPRFAFEKFPQTNDTLTTSMKSVGEVMAIGRNFAESLQKALRGLEVGLSGLDEIEIAGWSQDDSSDNKNAIRAALSTPKSDRLLKVAQAIRAGTPLAKVYELCKIDMWFLQQIKNIIDMEEKIIANGLPNDFENLHMLKSMGFSDVRLAKLANVKTSEVAKLRKKLKVRPVFKRIDTCAAEFSTPTAYMYSTYEREFANKSSKSNEANPSNKKKIIILGGGPNRIGQGIEFDYCCCHACFALSKAGYETIMINCNPETVSTDYDTSHRLYFEPLTAEDVLEIIRTEQSGGKLQGVIVQFGGQTPLNLISELVKAKVPILGTSYQAIDIAEDRDKFKKLLNRLKLKQPTNGIANSVAQAKSIVEKIGYPVVLRPSYVLGGRGMEIVHNVESFATYINEAVEVSGKSPLLIDSYLVNAVEVDVDCLSDGKNVFVCGIMEHIEEAGIHSGDSACSLPGHSLSKELVKKLEKQTIALAKALNVVGLMNIQFAIKGNDIFVLEVNPRASRTVPFVAKTIGVAIAGIAARVMSGEKLNGEKLNKILPKNKKPIKHFAVKEAVFPFTRFAGVDSLLGPEMRSTGEVMGLDKSYSRAFAKSQLAASSPLPLSGMVFLSVRNEDKAGILLAAKKLVKLGFTLVATGGTQRYLAENAVACGRINKVLEGRPHVVDAITNRQIDLIINTTHGDKARNDSYTIREAALQNKVPYYTTLAGCIAAVDAIGSLKSQPLEVASLQSYFA